MNAAGAKRTPWRSGLGMVFVLGLVGASLLPEPWKGRTAVKGGLHDCAHVLAFLVTFLLATDRRSNWRKCLLLGAGLLVLGVTLEMLESAEFNNRLEFRDMLDDGLGVAGGVLGRLLGASNPSGKGA